MKDSVKKPPEFLLKSQHLLQVCYPLVTGPNKYKSVFGEVLEYVFRKDYFTLQTIVVLVDMVQQDSTKLVIFAGSIVDLSRRVLEDMIYMEYMATKGKEKYAKQFLDFESVERKQDLDFMQKSGIEFNSDDVARIEKDYVAAPKKLKDGRHNWAGQSVEMVITWLVEQGKIEESKKKDVLALYILGNRKNHTSPSDIICHQNQQSLDGAAKLDIEMGLMITYGALARIGLFLIDETEADEKIKKALRKCWQSINETSYEHDKTTS